VTGHLFSQVYGRSTYAFLIEYNFELARTLSLSLTHTNTDSRLDQSTSKDRRRRSDAHSYI
jgi:hypothetical protein